MQDEHPSVHKLNDPRQKKAVSGFNKLAARYEHSFYARYTHRWQQSILDELQFLPTYKTLLDVGCGSGRFLKILQERHNTQVETRELKLYGVDIAEEMVKETKKKLLFPNLVYVFDAEDLPFAQSYFDVVTSSGVFHHFVNPQKTLREIYRVCKNEAYLLISDWWLPWGLRYLNNVFIFLYGEGDVKTYSTSELAMLISDAGFSILQTKNIFGSGQFVLARKGKNSNKVQ